MSCCVHTPQPLDVNLCPERAARNVHQPQPFVQAKLDAFDVRLQALGVVLLVQAFDVVIRRRGPNTDHVARHMERRADVSALIFNCSMSCASTAVMLICSNFSPSPSTASLPAFSPP
jgi:hypothetical protein